LFLTQICVCHDFRQPLALEKLGNFKDAIELYDLAISIDPQNDYILTNKGVALTKINQLNEALEIFKTVQIIKPADYLSICNEGVALYLLGQFEEAILAFNRALEINSDLQRILNFKSAALSALGRHKEALSTAHLALSKSAFTLRLLEGFRFGFRQAARDLGEDSPRFLNLAKWVWSLRSYYPFNLQTHSGVLEQLLREFFTDLSILEQ
jgi:tetratricopeptide (TPR) repeat protein